MENLHGVIFDLRTARYKLHDFLGMYLQGRFSEKEVKIEGNNNVFVALANIYIHTSSQTQFVNALRYLDLDLWRGSFSSLRFIELIKSWNRDDLKNEARLNAEEASAKKD